MKTNLPTLCLALAAAALSFPPAARAADPMQPHLETRHGATQLIVDGKPFLMLSGELRNSSTSSRDYMKPIWPQLAQRNLNTVLAVITWELIEPQEGRFDFTTVDDTIQGARQNHLHLVILWFGSWKNGESSYQPYWVKADPKRFPWAKDRAGKTLNILSTFGDATRDADARAFAALMRHLREVDGKEHTVLAMQVENEVGVLGDSRDHIAAANEAYAKPVPSDLMDYLVRHKDTLAPELRQVWVANGMKTSGTWEEVFGPGRPDFVPPVPASESDAAWHKTYWLSDEAFMAWRYSMYVGKVAAAGKAEYDIPMYCNTWLQEPSHPQPGQFPSGCPEPEVHDIWRFGAPKIDILAPDLYVPLFSETCERFIRNSNPLFIPETSVTASNALIAYLKYNSICFSPFAIEEHRPAEAGEAPTPADVLSQTYAILDYLAPVILDNQGKNTIKFLQPMDPTNVPSQELTLGDYTLKLTYGVSSGGRGGGRGGGRRGGGGGGGGGGRAGAGGEEAAAGGAGAGGMDVAAAGAGGGGRGRGGGGGGRAGGGRGGAGGGPGAGGGFTNSSPVRLVINSGPGDYWFVGGPMSVTFDPVKPGPGRVIMGIFEESIYRDGRWLPGRRLNGDDTGNNMRWQNMPSFGIYHYRVFQRE